MLNQLLSGNIPLFGPRHVALSPAAMLARIAVVCGFPAESARKAAPAAAQSACPEDDVSHAVKAQLETASPAAKPTIPAFAYIFHEEDTMVPATSKLVLFLPQDETRPNPVRVVERSACKAKWYAIETWHDNVQRWIDRGVAAKKDGPDGAISKARNMAWIGGTGEE